MSKLAVIKTGGKQYFVKEKEKILVEKLEKKRGEKVIFDKVLLLKDGKNLKIGKPYIEGAKVVGKVISQKKGKKIIVFKYKPKKRYRKKIGHRQLFTEIEIEKISFRP